MYLSLFVDIEGTRLTAEDKRVLAHSAVCGVILFSRNFSDYTQLIDLITEIKGLKEPRLLVSVDQEGGNVQRFRTPFTELPPLSDIGTIYNHDPKLGRRMASEHAAIMVDELRAVGVDFSFAPVVDIGNKNSVVLRNRTFSDKPEIVSELAVIYLQSMMERGMVSVAKHFPGHGGVEEDSHLQLPVDKREPFVIQNRDLLPYKILIENGLSAIMMAHLVYEKIDKEAAGYSKVWIKNILRTDLGFKGLVFSDDLSMKGAYKDGGIIARALLAVEAGCDILLICNDRVAVEELLKSVNDPMIPDNQRKSLDYLKARELTNEVDFKQISEENQKMLTRFASKINRNKP